MRFMVIVKADKDTEAGVMPSEKLLKEMGRLQRSAGQGRNHARRRRAASLVEGKAHPIQRQGSAR